MSIDTQFKLNSNPNYLRYLRQNSTWYKYLNRDPNAINDFIEKVKDEYKLRPSDRFNKALEYAEVLGAIFSSLN